MDLMRLLKPKILVPQHTRPIEGQAEIMEILTAYRDAIQLVHDQTVRYMNKGLYPDEITRKVRLPPYLAKHPYLQEFYGTVEWSVKGVFTTYMGWFSGKASELHPLERVEKSKNLVDLAGGIESLVEKMRLAYGEGKYQWTLELAEAVLDVKNGDKTAIVSLKFLTGFLNLIFYRKRKFSKESAISKQNNHAPLFSYVLLRTSNHFNFI